MSGTGADGSSGLKAVKAKGGLVLAQDAREAEYDGMPRSAIATGEVDHILPAAKIAAILVERETFEVPDGATSHRTVSEILPDIVDLLRKKTAHDFTLCKRGTLQRHVSAEWRWPASRR
jgi:two-component system CheB/CheR fusion protein